MAAGTGSRDSRIDWLRGLALASIFVNHMPGNRLENWTTRNFGFSDAAEVFVLLAGVAAAFAFYKRFEKGDVWGTTQKSIRRVGTLYTAHIFSTLAAIALFAVAARLAEDPGYLELIGVAPLFQEPWPGLVGIALGTYQLGYFNILPMYILLLSALPLYLWLARVDLRLMLAASFAVYLAAQTVPLTMPSYPEGGGWYFNPFAWQFLFAIGLALGVLKTRGSGIPYHPVAYAAALAWAVLGAVWMIWSLGGHISHGLLPGWIDTLHKSALPMPRLLHVLALAYLLVHSRVWVPLSRLSNVDPVTTRLGRNSLPVFVAGSLMSMVGYATLVQTGNGLAIELVLTTAGLIVMWMTALISEQGLAAVTADALSGLRSIAPRSARLRDDIVATVRTGRDD
jgi:hypothetical protein